MYNIIVFGPPGSGKGTQSARLVHRYGLDHLSTGALLRSEISKGTALGKSVETGIRRGELIPDEIVLRMAMRFAVQNKQGRGVVFDGFPRTLNQAELLDRHLSKRGLAIDLVIYIDISEEEATKRILGRSTDSNREDDKLDIIARRIKIFREQTFPVISYYHRQGKFACVSGMAMVDEVFNKICTVINTRLPELAQISEHGR